MLKTNLVLDFYSIYLMYETRSSQLVLDAMEYKDKGTMYVLFTHSIISYTVRYLSVGHMKPKISVISI